jgi:hypothetical protein
MVRILNLMPVHGLGISTECEYVRMSTYSLSVDHEELLGRSVTPRLIPDQRYLLLAAL